VGKVYVITSGCYSDYHICAVTLDPQKAKVLKEFYSRTEYDEPAIEEYDADYCYDRITSGCNPYCVRFTRSGAVDCVFETQGCCEDKVYQSENGWHVYVELWAKDKLSAVKIAAERRAKFLAEKEGIA
jgi:hypothetical protein